MIIKNKIRAIIRNYIITLLAGNSFITDLSNVEELTEKIEQYLYNLPHYYSLINLFFILVFEYSIPPLCFKFRPFRKHTLEKKLDILAKWENSRINFKRLVFMSIKSTFMYHIYSQEKVLIAIGYEKALQDRKHLEENVNCRR